MNSIVEGWDAEILGPRPETTHQKDEQVSDICKWVGGNDYMACQTCGVEYDYRKYDRPPCGAAARITALEAELAAEKADKAKHPNKFHIGQLVKVAEWYIYSADWRDAIMKIVAAELHQDGTVRYTTSDVAHPKDGHTDGWRESDLVAYKETA